VRAFTFTEADAFAQPLRVSRFEELDRLIAEEDLRAREQASDDELDPLGLLEFEQADS
jgi:hypothetical protein